MRRFRLSSLDTPSPMPAVKLSPPDPGLLSLNTATVREKWNLREMIERLAG